ncbi:MAG: chemotaxis protein CheW [Bdellovibrionota bacterium]|nr:chemotaxis protein CheW [Bdellovibrionota bacterium]
MEREVLNTDNVQYCTFQIGDDFFGVDVLKVQEVIKPLQLTEIPKSDDVVCGLMNLRGNIVTQISLRKLFGLKEDNDQEHMNVIVNTSDGLLSLKVDEIDDVQSLNMSSFEKTPDTLDSNIKKYVKGIHKLDGRLLVVLDLEEIEGFAGE